ncbi:MAG TPA: hypothetical protein PK054_06195 [Anaerohalosphaeraceae bacterium]|nr:hypothetical protein [Anaerohalosphaeraceae bacterium]HOL88915.1 hypothetical protein [Anaerohalosphaeraceae bacterium]HPP56159.1 hypothetical protein [Anaerohalosphaeraceae bacterium]
MNILKDNYNFEGGNDAAMWFAPPLSFVISVGTPFDAVGSSPFFVHEEFVK